MAVESDRKPVAVVTGASGLIGVRLTDELSSSYSCVALDVKPLPAASEALWIECDFTDRGSRMDTFRKMKDRL